ncbi:MAG: hypothetical protein KGV59_00055 [Tenacibaculum sp.]|nr:hypothetical protein [Tenacibaculum sp.]
MYIPYIHKTFNWYELYNDDDRLIIGSNNIQKNYGEYGQNIEHKVLDICRYSYNSKVLLDNNIIEYLIPTDTKVKIINGKNIKHLHTHHDPNDLDDFLRTNPNLISLSIHIKKGKEQILSILPETLEYLRIFNLKTDVRILQKYKQITNLQLDRCDIVDFAELQLIPNLHSLQINRCKELKNEGVLLEMKNIKRVEISNNKEEGDIYNVLAKMRKCGQILNNDIP